MHLTEAADGSCASIAIVGSLGGSTSARLRSGVLRCQSVCSSRRRQALERYVRTWSVNFLILLIIMFTFQVYIYIYSFENICHINFVSSSSYYYEKKATPKTKEMKQASVHLREAADAFLPSGDRTHGERSSLEDVAAEQHMRKMLNGLRLPHPCLSHPTLSSLPWYCQHPIHVLGNLQILNHYYSP